MLRLRNILLHNTIFIFILVITIFVTIIRINNAYSEYSNDYIIGRIYNYKLDKDKLTIIIGKEKVYGVYYFKDKSITNINIGDTYKINGEFKIPSKLNYKYKYICNIKSIKKISNNRNIFYIIKNLLIKRLNNNPYLYTFVLGNTDYIDSDVKRSYRENGISHLFAISGMHISLLSNIIIRILLKLRISENKRYFITSSILIIYLLLVGISPSILRGVLFFILFSINRVYYFYIKSTNIFIVTLCITLLINPYFIYDIGFMYSFTISLGLILSSNYLSSGNYLVKLLKTSFISFIVSIPISLYNFYQINLLSIIYNLFFVPFISYIVFPLSLICLFIPKLIIILNIFTNILEYISLYLNNIDIFKLIFIKLNIFIYIIYFIIGFLIIRKRKFIILLILLLLIHYVIDSGNYIRMIDVGQGDSIIIHSNRKTIMFDTGGVYGSNNSIVINKTIPMLKSLGIKRIDYLVLTHGDFDHLGESFNLIDNYKVDNIILNSNNFNYLERKLISKYNNISVVDEGSNISLGELELVELNTNLLDENDSSLVYFGIYKDISMLFTGDASYKSEEYILNNYELGDIDILKIGHHGSYTSTSELLLEHNIKIGLISCGKDNKFKHPHKETLDKLKKHNIKYYRTDRDGSITINLDNLKITTGGN